jgi:hypothetical protein
VEDISDNPAGMYIVTASVNGVMKTAKLIKID